MTFQTGTLYMTAGVNKFIYDNREFAKFVSESWKRYKICDWGDLPNEDKKMNDSAVKNNDDRIVARYNYNRHDIYIITEYDRSHTTILFTFEY